MSRPVYYFDTENVEYTFVEKGAPPALCVLDFLIEIDELGLLKRKKAFMSTKTGGLQFEIKKVSKRPGPPVDGKHPVRVEALRMLG